MDMDFSLLFTKTGYLGRFWVGCIRSCQKLRFDPIATPTNHGTNPTHFLKHGHMSKNSDQCINGSGLDSRNINGLELWVWPESSKRDVAHIMLLDLVRDVFRTFCMLPHPQLSRLFKSLKIICHLVPFLSPFRCVPFYFFSFVDTTSKDMLYINLFTFW